ncbi:helix-turn-helix domain-containing protein [Streptomyces sp. NPDC056632]|uniref:helix-turn-helix domain-containing protein n=1 Tax=Streptomyces sp. NPDC056632 TaxID=3345884 RepID=UPI0036A9DF0A
MRYAQGGGLTDAGRTARERVRLQAVERFKHGEKNKDIADALRVTERSVERWRRQGRERGEAGVLSKGSPGRPRLNEKQIARLERPYRRRGRLPSVGPGMVPISVTAGATSGHYGRRKAPRPRRRTKCVTGVPSTSPHRDRSPRRRAVLGPGTVVVLDVRVAEQVVDIKQVH